MEGNRSEGRGASDSSGPAQVKLMGIADFGTAGNGVAGVVEKRLLQLEAVMAEAYGANEPSVHQLLHRYVAANI